MAGKYTKTELKKMLHESAFHIVMTEGIERITIRKLSRGCGLSDPYIYQCYSDIPDLLESAYMEIDKKVAELIQRSIKTSPFELNSKEDLDKFCWYLWRRYWNFLMDYPEQTVFYWRYYQSSYYSKELWKYRRENFEMFITFVAKTAQIVGLTEKTDIEILMSNIIDNSVSVAVKIHLGYMNAERVGTNDIYEAVFAFMYDLIGIDVLKERE